ncbi:G-type lectin S-receptor-like serine/threonine-protein kinase At4g27290 [Cornus florida]|uniref:G-type lectin S-receptor-like serine/threonine-protein kinase At4g27290 n=1 Tax=Cornus florida TaxID=4283 RepID=UPI0028A05338|nr:G-type lectin S-receptor-like serine/threonine-protein kinase At4g27290 [Cornus florida]
MGTFAFFILSHSLISSLTYIKFCFAFNKITSNQSISDGQILVSSGQRFELGFFSPGNNKNRYLGIWYKNAPHIAVWVANRNSPITDSSGVLTITNNATLVLHNRMKSPIWSSNTSRVAESPFVQLLDTGNLVIMDKTRRSTESYIWQSFDFPSDTRLPDMKIGKESDDDLERYLVSWKSADDPSPGAFTYRIDDNHGLPQLVILGGSAKTYRTGPWNGIQFSSFTRFINLAYSPVFVYNKDNSYYVYEPYNYTAFTRLTLNQSGFLQRYRLNERSNEWSLLYTLPKDQCDSYRQCGANGICRIQKAPVCECLNGFTPKLQEDWQMQDWSSGCMRRTALDCQSEEGFLKVEKVKLPDLLDQFWLNKSMSLRECKAECLKNCSCVAYANSNISEGGSGCLMWFGDLIDIREFTGEGNDYDIYIRLAASELESIHNSNKKNKLVIILVVSSLSGLLIMGMVLWCGIWKKRIKRKGEDWELPLVDFSTIVTATNNFSLANMLGEGGFGPVYKANLSNGQEIAVKRLSRNSRQGLEEFKNEVTLIAKLQHRNLVRLLGCCIQKEERMLIYEYMSNKSLDYFIFDQDRSALLPWGKRFNIFMGIARGLLYLHQDSRLRIIHRDLKTSNILLDSEMNPKISDFGLARNFESDQIYAKTRRVIGTHGYMSPEYVVHGKFSMKSDVFSFGVLLLEIVSGRRNRGFFHSKHNHNLLGHAWILWHEDKGLELMDACLKDSCVESSQVLRCIQVGLLCVQKLSEDRPPMSSVVSMLGNEGSTIPQPKQPGFFTESSSTDDEVESKDIGSHTNDTATITMLEPR